MHQCFAYTQEGVCCPLPITAAGRLPPSKEDVDLTVSHQSKLSNNKNLRLAHTQQQLKHHLYSCSYAVGSSGCVVVCGCLLRRLVFHELQV
jgi:hypothetical protein